MGPKMTTSRVQNPRIFTAGLFTGMSRTSHAVPANAWLDSDGGWGGDLSTFGEMRHRTSGTDIFHPANHHVTAHVSGGPPGLEHAPSQDLLRVSRSGGRPDSNPGRRACEARLVPLSCGGSPAQWMVRPVASCNLHRGAQSTDCLRAMLHG